MSKPLLHALLIVCCPTFGVGQQSYGVYHICETTAIDDPGSSPSRDPRYSLAKVEIGVHARCRIKEPRTQQHDSACRVGFIAGQVIAKRQSARKFSNAAHVLVVRDFFNLRISFTVAANVRKSAGGFGIGPPVRAHAHIVMLIAAPT